MQCPLYALPSLVRPHEFLSWLSYLMPVRCAPLAQADGSGPLSASALIAHLAQPQSISGALEALGLFATLRFDKPFEFTSLQQQHCHQRPATTTTTLPPEACNNNNNNNISRRALS
jgi:hypothetical protein